jgi:hypothetical protein
MIFAGGPTLEQHAPAVVEEENRKGPMQRPPLVGTQLLFRSDLAIVRIHQDDAFFGDRCDGQVMLRRLALACAHSS